MPMSDGLQDIMYYIMNLIFFLLSFGKLVSKPIKHGAWDHYETMANNDRLFIYLVLQSISTFHKDLNLGSLYKNMRLNTISLISAKQKK